jgi:NADPH-dependent ferric siderophore reductase
VPGQAATIARPRGSLIIAADLRWHLLVGDETALPAIARRLEELPSSTRATVILQTDDPADRRPLRSPAALQVQWVDHTEALLRAVSELALENGSESNPGANTA